jgi:hypothetical protein
MLITDTSRGLTTDTKAFHVQDCRQECKDLRGHFWVINVRVDDGIAPLLLHFVRRGAIRICASTQGVVV